MYLKWEDETIGVIDSSNSLHLLKPGYNNAIQVIFGGAEFLSPTEWQNFLEDRVVSRQRRDINKILFYFGLSQYDVFAIADQTRAISAKDKLWLAQDENEQYGNIAEKQLTGAFGEKVFINNNTFPSPNGVNIKRYGIYNNHFGIIKQRLSPLITDAESEIAVPLIAKEMGVECCPAFRVNNNEIFSQFEYDWRNESVVHFSSILKGRDRRENEVEGILAIRPQYKEDVFKMLVLDFVTRQDDRHLSNFAVKIKGDEESFYPLYDNGRSLFFEDTLEMVKDAVKDPILYATTFGLSGTYYDHIEDMLQKDPNLINSVNLNISSQKINEILKISGFKDHRLEGAQKWIASALSACRELGLSKSAQTINNMAQNAKDTLRDDDLVSEEKNSEPER